MPTEVILPRVDMEMTTGKISKWFVAAGTKVNKGQPLFEIETDKAAMEIEADASGYIRDMADVLGQDLPVGSIVAWIYREGETPVGSPPAAPDTKAATIEGPGDPYRQAVERSSGTAERQDRQPASASPHPPDDDGVQTRRPGATPLARRLALERGLDLTQVQGSGPRGRIQARDIPLAATDRINGASARSGPEPILKAAARFDAREPQDQPPPVIAKEAGAVRLIQLREGTGTPLVLLHGFGGDVNMWRPFLSGPRLSRPVYGLDLPGHGSSALGRVASFSGLVDVVEAALREAALSTMCLVGHSLGGGVVAALAARGSLDVQSVLLLAPAGLGPEINGAFLRGYLAATSEASLTPWMRELVVEPGAITPAFIRATLQARESVDVVSGQRRVADTVFPDGTQSFSVRTDLARLPMPARIVFGAADRIIPARHATGLPGEVALHLFPGVGHMPQFEVPQAVASIIAQMA